MIWHLARRRFSTQACEQRTPLPGLSKSSCCGILTSHQVWGVTEEYFKENVFPDASDSVLSTLGSMSGMVRPESIVSDCKMWLMITSLHSS